MVCYFLKEVTFLGEGPFPGVLDIFGTTGSTIEHRAALLASRGIAALALCYYLPEVVREVEYFVSAVEHLLAHPKVSSHGAAVVGVSKGCDMAYLVSIVCPKVTCAFQVLLGFKLIRDVKKIFIHLHWSDHHLTCEWKYLSCYFVRQICASVNISGADRVQFEPHTYKGETFHRDE